MKTTLKAIILIATLALISSAFHGVAKAPSQEIVLPDIVITE